jgi:hypothetical protein
LEKGGISPYVLNNNLITNVSTMGGFSYNSLLHGLGQWYKNKKPIPNIYDKIYLDKYTENTSGSATNVYNSFIKPRNNSANSTLDVLGYQFANGFNVYDPMIEEILGLLILLFNLATIPKHGFNLK